MLPEIAITADAADRCCVEADGPPIGGNVQQLAVLVKLMRDDVAHDAGVHQRQLPRVM